MNDRELSKNGDATDTSENPVQPHATANNQLHLHTLEEPGNETSPHQIQVQTSANRPTLPTHSTTPCSSTNPCRSLDMSALEAKGKIGNDRCDTRDTFVPDLRPTSTIRPGSVQAEAEPGHTQDNESGKRSDTMPAGPNVGSLQKRRASLSPDKANGNRFKPLKIHTDLKNAASPPPPKRRRTEKLEVHYDERGASKISTNCCEPSYTSSSPFLSGHEGNTSVTPSSQHRTLDQDLNKNAWSPSASTPISDMTVSKTQTTNKFTSRILNDLAGNFTSPEDEASPIATTKEVFQLLGAFVQDNALCIILVSYLDLPSLISWYAIDKDFHWTYNNHATAFALSSMRTWSPNAEQIFPWRCYAHLCIKDPVQRQKSVKRCLSASEADIEKLPDQSRDVPSLRWIQMVTWRHAIAEDIIMQLNIRALRCPLATVDSIKRLWFMLDLPLNSHRLALMRSEIYFPRVAIVHLTHFLLKIDMAFTEPGAKTTHRHPLLPTVFRHAYNGCRLREMLLSQRNLTPLWRVLKGWTPNPDEGALPMTRVDIALLWTRYQFRSMALAPLRLRQLKPELVSYALQHMGVVIGGERHSRIDPRTGARIVYTTDRKLLRPDELLIGESVRRRLKMHTRYTSLMLWGFIGSQGRNIPVFSEEELMRAKRRPFDVPEKIVEEREEMKEEKRIREERLKKRKGGP